MNLAYFTCFTSRIPTIIPPVAATHINFDWPNESGPFALGTDNWPHTWAADGNLYASGGDGPGFTTGGQNQLIVSRITGTNTAPAGTDVFAGLYGGKTYGILSVNGGELYILHIPGSDVTNYSVVTIKKSIDSGATWTSAVWNWPKAVSNITMPTFLQMGQDYSLNSDGYVYLYANGLEDATQLGIQTDGVAGYVYLARCPKAEIMTAGSWQWYTGAGPTWGAIGNKAPVITDTDGVGWCTSGVAFHPGTGKYLAATEHTLSAQGNIKIWTSDAPWGPWGTIYTTQFPLDGGYLREVFNLFFVTKWFTPTGGVVAISGADNDLGPRKDDALWYVPFTLS